MAEEKKKTGTTAKSTGAKKNTSLKGAKGAAAALEVHGNATGLRIGAVVLWLLAIAFEILAILMVFGKFEITFMPTLACLIIFIVLDLVCVIIGSQLWKKANRIDPASEKNALKFWLWNNMGLIVSVFAFLPLIILMFTNKEKLDNKTRIIATIAAIIALLIAGAASYDWNPVSEEGKEAAMQEVTGTVYWTTFGKVYHTSETCSHINGKDNVDSGDVKTAIESGRTRMCKTCADRDGYVIDENGAVSTGSNE